MRHKAVWTATSLLLLVTIFLVLDKSQASQKVFTTSNRSCVLSAGAVPELRCFGGGAHYALGYSPEVWSIGRADSGSVMSGQPVEFANKSAVVIQVAGSTFTACALTDAGQVICFGRNDGGQVGQGTTTTVLPQQLPPIDMGGDFVVEIAGGLDQVCARSDLGVVRCFGGNSHGELGINSNASVGGPSLSIVAAGAVPLPLPAAQIVTGRRFSCAVLEGRNLIKCWGNNQQMQLGYEDTTLRVGIDANSNNIALYPPLSVSPATFTPVIAAGGETTCAVLSNHTLKCWGSNTYGQFAIGQAIPDNCAPFERYAPKQLPAGLTAVQIAMGDDFGCLLFNSGSIYCWGSNGDCYRLGQGANFYAYGLAEAVNWDRPVSLPLGSFALGVSSSPTSSSACAVTASRAVFCWGANDFGQLGTNQNSHVGGASLSITTAVVLCGDGFLDGEECDDGNFNPGDGCSPQCTVEAGWECESAPEIAPSSQCSFCGDGFVELAELCDDQNSVDGDGCDSKCRVEFGYACDLSVQPSVCTQFNLLNADVSLGPQRTGLDSQLHIGANDSLVLRFQLEPLRTQLAAGVVLPPLTRLELACPSYKGSARLQLALATSPMALTFVESELSLATGAQELLDTAQLQDESFASFDNRVRGLLRGNISQLFQRILYETSDENVTLLLLLQSGDSSAITCWSREGTNETTQQPRIYWPTLSSVEISRGQIKSSKVAAALGGSLGAAALIGCCCCGILILVLAAAGALALFRRHRRALHAPIKFPSALPFGMASLEANAFAIDPQQLELHRLLGRGAAGQVYSGAWLQGKSRTPVAIKRIPLPANVTPQEEEELQSESRMLAQLHHPNVLRFYGLAVAQGDLLLVCELMSKGSLEHCLHSAGDDAPPPSPQQRLHYAVETARGLVYLHRENILHRDIKPANLLISADDHVKIADFGIARMRSHNGTSTMTSLGTPHYMAPEACRGDKNVGKPIDVYSFGIVLWEMATLQRPYPGLVVPQVVFQVTQGHRPDMAAVTVPALLAWCPIIEQCWHHDPAQRPTIEAVLEALTALE